jgi:hypothetical protein
MTFPESFRLSGPLSGYLTFLTKRMLGVSRTITHRGDWYYSASGPVLLPSPPSLVPPTLTLCLVLSGISPPSPAASRRVGAPLCFNATLYIYNIYLGVSLPSPPLLLPIQTFPLLPPLPLYCLLWHIGAPNWMSLVKEYTCPLKTPFGDPHDYNLLAVWL